MELIKIMALLMIAYQLGAEEYWFIIMCIMLTIAMLIEQKKK